MVRLNLRKYQSGLEVERDSENTNENSFYGDVLLFFFVFAS